MHATIRRYDGVDQNRTDELTRKVNGTLVPKLEKLPGFGGYFLIEAGNGVFSSLCGSRRLSRARSRRRSSPTGSARRSSRRSFPTGRAEDHERRGHRSQRPRPGPRVSSNLNRTSGGGARLAEPLFFRDRSSAGRRRAPRESCAGEARERHQLTWSRRPASCCSPAPATANSCAGCRRSWPAAGSDSRRCWRRPSVCSAHRMLLPSSRPFA